MATLATEADLHSRWRGYHIDELLRTAYQPSDTQAAKDAAMQAKLDSALADGDAVLRRYLDVPSDWTELDAVTSATLLPFARDFAYLALKRGTSPGLDPEDQELETKMIHDLVKMRDRDQWTAGTTVQAPTASEYVPSTSSFRGSRLVGLV